MIALPSISEDQILDSFKLRKELNPDIFSSDPNPKLKDVVRNALLQIADRFMRFLGVQFFIHDVILTGSLANYNWSRYSDVDLHIVIDMGEAGHDIVLLKEFFDSKKVVWNSAHNIKIKGYDVEVYVQDTNETHDSTGIYSVLNNKWILKPQQHHVRIDKKQIKQKVDMWMDIIDKLSGEKDTPDILEKVEKVRDRLKKFRKCGLDEGGEFSYENLVFKYLRRNDYVKKLLDLKGEIMDRQLSLDQ